jgi:hypothetical protein
MNATQRRIIIAAVLAGCSWTGAALAAGLTPEQLVDAVRQAQQSGCKLKLRFIHCLRKAGQQATEASLKQHRGAPEHA